MVLWAGYNSNQEFQSRQWSFIVHLESFDDSLGFSPRFGHLPNPLGLLCSKLLVFEDSFVVSNRLEIMMPAKS